MPNNANVLTMGVRVVGVGLAEEILQAFFSTEATDEERHLRRVSMFGK
jgi:ribose 5-phosphate isomerase B